MRQKNNLGKITKVKRHIQIRKKEFSNFRFVGVEKSGVVEVILCEYTKIKKNSKLK